jgi:CheY-like chemotaxis protein
MTRIMVVDDEIETLTMMATLLEVIGYEPCTTYSPKTAPLFAQFNRPDCILLDIMMPEMDGFQLCKILRNSPATADLPILFVTAYPAFDLEDRRRDAGADKVVMKPFALDKLIGSIEEVLTARSNSHPALLS